MRMQQTFFGRAKSLAGAALIGLGIFIFHGNLNRAATQWSHLLSATPGEALGLLPTGSPSRFAGLRRRSSAFSAGFPSTHIRAVLAAAARHGRNGIVAGYPEGRLQRTAQERLRTCRSGCRPGRKGVTKGKTRAASPCG